MTVIQMALGVMLGMLFFSLLSFICRIINAVHFAARKEADHDKT